MPSALPTPLSLLSLLIFPRTTHAAAQTPNARTSSPITTPINTTTALPSLQTVLKIA
ncbi:MAG: hypothetical protein M1830_004056, partial [Pleopsidium flavum]